MRSYGAEAMQAILVLVWQDPSKKGIHHLLQPLLQEVPNLVVEAASRSATSLPENVQTIASRFSRSRQHQPLSTTLSTLLSIAHFHRMAFAITQTPAISFKSSIGDARPFVAGRPISRPMRTSIVPLARGPSLKNKNNIAKVPSCGKRKRLYHRTSDGG